MKPTHKRFIVRWYHYTYLWLLPTRYSFEIDRKHGLSVLGYKSIFGWEFYLSHDLIPYKENQNAIITK